MRSQPSAASSALSLDQAVPLGYAIVLRAAQDVGSRALGIKGPAMALQGIRDVKQSVDVDVLVEPRGRDALLAELGRLGWVADETAIDMPLILPPASIPLRHALWPCEVDLHHWFPGFLADPAEVFEVLWTRRAAVELAHRDVAVPDRVAHAAIHALHHLRDGQRSAVTGHVAELIERVTSTWSPEDIADLASLAADVGASATLAPLLDGIGAPHVPARAGLVVPVSDWHLRAEMQSPATLRWIVGLRRARWRDRPRLLWRALWPDEQHLTVDSLSTPLTARELRVTRWRRIRRGVRAMPAAVADYRRNRV